MRQRREKHWKRSWSKVAAAARGAPNGRRKGATRQVQLQVRRSRKNRGKVKKLMIDFIESNCNVAFSLDLGT